MQNAVQQISKAASGNANVHIYGEIGTGKQVAAAMIHELSGRAAYPLITIDCAEYQKKSMWSGCLEAKKSLAVNAEKQVPEFLHQAGAGTLILDGINQMGFDLQATLLRVLKQTTNPTGACTPVPRIVTTSRLDPQILLRQGTLKPELFEHLNPELIMLKPLRDCKEDLPALANYYFCLYGNSPGKWGLPESIMQRLLDYDWPGNLYELQNTIQRYLVYDEILFIPAKTVSANETLFGHYEKNQPIGQKQ